MDDGDDDDDEVLAGWCARDRITPPPFYCYCSRLPRWTLLDIRNLIFALLLNELFENLHEITDSRKTAGNLPSM